MAYMEIEPGIWKAEKDGDFVEGVFIKAEENVGTNDSMLYHLEVEEKPMSVWGSAVLDQRMMFVRPGERIKITFKGLGEKSGGKNAAKIFKVEVDHEDKPETPSE